MPQIVSARWLETPTSAVLPSRPMALKKKRAKSAGSRPARTGAVAAFILSQPLDATADSVVEAGKAAGHAFSKNYVYAARAKAKGAGKTATGKRGRPAAGTKDAIAIAARASRALAKLSAKGVASRRSSQPVETAGVAPSGPERELAALIVQVGTARAEQILHRVRDALSKLSF